MITIGYLAILPPACFSLVKPSSGVYTFMPYTSTDLSVNFYQIHGTTPQTTVIFI